MIACVYVGPAEIKGEGEQAVVGPEFTLLVQIDSALRFSWGEKPPGPDKTRQFISVQLTEHHWELRYREAAPREVWDVRKWRIKDLERRPLITLDPAIRYVTESRDKSDDPVIKRNADRTLAILGKYRSK